MTFDEIDQIMKAIATAEVTKWPLEDQLLAFSIYMEFAKKMKPLVIKNELNSNNSSTFLFKL